MRDSTIHGVTPGSSESLEGHNLVNTCPNGASDESTGIYTKSRGQWSGLVIKSKLEQGRFGRLNP